MLPGRLEVKLMDCRDLKMSKYGVSAESLSLGSRL